MGLHDDDIQAEFVEEQAALMRIAMAVSDYLLGLDMPEFAEEFGGIEAFMQEMRDASADWETRFNTEPEV